LTVTAEVIKARGLQTEPRTSRGVKKKTKDYLRVRRGSKRTLKSWDIILITSKGPCGMALSINKLR